MKTAVTLRASGNQMSNIMTLPSYVLLGDDFYASSSPADFPDSKLMFWNDALADELQLQQLPDFDDEKRALYFSGQSKLLETAPVALAYAGHQFGNFVPRLGDGRAHLIAELTDTHGHLREIQLKGSGRTPFSRGGDGLCALGPAIREYIMSEALHALGVPTSRSLAVVLSGKSVFRDTVQPGAVVTRVASSHIRVGTFQYFAARQNHNALEKLVAYTIERHYSDANIKTLSLQEQALYLFEQAIEQHITMVSEWLRIGFIHGVMNTDNAPLSGETIDFGPCAMLGAYDPATVYSSIDHHGRYAFGNQPDIAQWNLARLAECLIPFADSDTKKSAEKLSSLLHAYPDKFRATYHRVMLKKAGLYEANDDNISLLSELLETLQTSKIDYTTGFNALTELLSDKAQSLPDALQAFSEKWLNSVRGQGKSDSEVYSLMRSANPVIIPRNHIVEKVIKECEESLSAEPAQAFIEALKDPYNTDFLGSEYDQTPHDNDQSYQTFCGT
jgi:uncharacterized protein YdiU (UPF0061 family)